MQWFYIDLRKNSLTYPLNSQEDKIKRLQGSWTCTAHSQLLSPRGTMRLLLSFSLAPHSKYVDGFQGVSSPQCLGVFHFQILFSWKTLFLVISGSPLGSRIHLDKACLHCCGHCHLLAGSETIELFSWKWLLLLEDSKVSLMFQPLAPLYMTLYNISVLSLLSKCTSIHHCGYVGVLMTHCLKIIHCPCLFSGHAWWNVGLSVVHSFRQLFQGCCNRSHSFCFPTKQQSLVVDAPQTQSYFYK